ncbi:glycosyltransferase family 4 protein [Gloeobacter morelensis]|uniref:Glycosyltransferase family 4 protein n=1 Tax=Gloeobacter morelensis MG652769 TaxID=2781736 RepID=A0ABY3PSH0_9CYAN|nr:glycosyltransferase family 4 protein [Gloeobacter morelensis]UFP96673.1 glycosyltransferase family 4 protein [Gloeobacter morelensis MG652769]
MSLKVCIATLEFPPDVGGVGESVHRIAHFLRDLGYAVHIAVFRSEPKAVLSQGPRRAQCLTTEQDGLTVHRLKPPIRSADASKQEMLSDLYFQLCALHRRYGFDVLHAFFLSETGYLFTLLGREHGVPVINSIRGSDIHKHMFSPLLHAQMVWTLENSVWVTFVSRDLQSRAALFAPAIREKSSAFWNSIDPVRFDNLPEAPLPYPLRGTVIGSVGRFRDKKGIEFLLDACGRLLAESLDVTLLLVGDFVPKEAAYWQLEVENAGLGDRLLVTGLLSREQALACYALLDIFVIPSLHDGCPNALLEAMTAGRAIVGTRADAIGEILDHERDALLVPPCDSEALAAALGRLVASPDLRRQLGEAARYKVSEWLAPWIEQQHWSEIYRHVLPQTDAAAHSLPATAVELPLAADH